jgi:hypothetical protein
MVCPVAPFLVQHAPQLALSLVVAQSVEAPSLGAQPAEHSTVSTTTKSALKRKEWVIRIWLSSESRGVCVRNFAARDPRRLQRSSHLPLMLDRWVVPKQSSAVSGKHARRHESAC